MKKKKKKHNYRRIKYLNGDIKLIIGNKIFDDISNIEVLFEGHKEDDNERYTIQIR